MSRTRHVWECSLATFPQYPICARFSSHTHALFILIEGAATCAYEKCPSSCIGKQTLRNLTSNMAALKGTAQLKPIETTCRPETHCAHRCTPGTPGGWPGIALSGPHQSNRDLRQRSLAKQLSHQSDEACKTPTSLFGGKHRICYCNWSGAGPRNLEISGVTQLVGPENMPSVGSIRVSNKAALCQTRGRIVEPCKP